MYVYDKLFSEYNHTVAQILLTSADIKDSQRKENFQTTVRRLLELKALPIINENDSVATEELGIGDNDTLGAIVATSVDADILILLSDINGLYTSDPHKDINAKLIHTVNEITPEILSFVDGAGSKFGTGGMTTKISAAQLVTEKGIDMVIANGEDPEILYEIIAGNEAGTKFIGRKA